MDSLLRRHAAFVGGRAWLVLAVSVVVVPLTMLVSCPTTLTLLPALIPIRRPRFLRPPAGAAEDSRRPLLRTAASR